MALDNLRQAAQGVITGNLRRVAGNLPGMLGGGRGDNSSKYKKLDRAKSPHSVDNLQFPIDVDSDPGLGNHGHYMMFYINQQDHAKLSFGDPAEPKQSGVDNIGKALKEHNILPNKNLHTEKQLTLITMEITFLEHYTTLEDGFGWLQFCYTE